MAATEKASIPWFPLILLLFGIILFWIVPAVQGETRVKVVSDKGNPQ